MEARQRKLAQYLGDSTKSLVNNITPAEGAVRPAENLSPVRNSNTYKSTMNLGGPSDGKSARDIYLANVKKMRSPEKLQSESEVEAPKYAKKRVASNTFKSTINVYEPELKTGAESAGMATMAAPEVKQPPKTARNRA